MEQTLLENKEIKEDPYVRHKLNKIQDKFLEIGFLDTTTYKQITKKKLETSEMENIIANKVSNILQNYIYANYPDLFSNIFDKLENSQKITHNQEGEKIIFKKFNISPNEISQCLIEISEYAKMTNIDINAEDYENQKFNFDFYNKPIPEKNIEHIPTKPEYTKLYKVTKSFFEKLEVNKINITNLNQRKKFNYYTNLILAFYKINVNIGNKNMKDAIDIFRYSLENENVKKMRFY